MRAGVGIGVRVVDLKIRGGVEVGVEVGVAVGVGVEMGVGLWE